jgi:hypothetical protein
VVQTGFVVRELAEKFSQCHTGLGFVLFHAPNIHPNHPLCQGDNSDPV